MGDLDTPLLPTDHGVIGVNSSNSTNGTPTTTCTTTNTAATLVWEEPVLKINLTLVVVLGLIYVTVFLMAVVGNLVVLCVIVKNRRFHSPTYYFIGNLAIADLLVAVICLPITLLSNIFSGWMFGAFMCKAVPYLQGVSVCASVNTLVVIAVDRYIAICHVMRQRNTKRSARIILLVIWILSFLIILPWALFYKQKIHIEQGRAFYYCAEEFPDTSSGKGFFLGIIFLMLYCLPMILIAVFYFMIGYRVWHRDAPGITSSKGVIEKSKVKVVKMLVVVVLLFMISWMPLYIIRLKNEFFQSSDDAADLFVSLHINPFAQWLGTSNSCMNPLVYCLFSQKIRRRIRAMLCCSKQEARSLYSTRSVYNSALQQSNSTRDSSFRLDPCANGHGSYHGQPHHHGGSVGSGSGGNCYYHRPSRQNSDLIRLNRNSTMSTHV